VVIPRSLLITTIALALFLPLAVCVFLGVESLLGAMGDEAGQLVVQRIRLALLAGPEFLFVDGNAVDAPGWLRAGAPRWCTDSQIICGDGCNCGHGVLPREWNFSGEYAPVTKSTSVVAELFLCGSPPSAAESTPMSGKVQDPEY